MDDFKRDDKLTTLDIANPIPAQDVRASDEMRREEARGTNSLRESFRRDQSEVRDETTRAQPVTPPVTPVAGPPVVMNQDVRGDVADNARSDVRGGVADDVRRDVRGAETFATDPNLRTSDLAKKAETVEQQRAQGGPVATTAAEPQRTALFPEDELHNFRARWDQVQTSFVDEPRKAVEEADSLVANVVKRIAEQFASEREGLEKQWDRGDNVSTEDLRQGLRRYRAFFDRLLSV